MIADALLTFARRVLAVVLIAATLLAGFALWQQHALLQRQAADLVAAQRDAATLAERNRAQGEQLAAQDIDIKLQIAAGRELAGQLSALSRQHAAAAAKLEAAIHATPDAVAWGSAAIPGPVARLFDTTGRAAAPAADPALPDGDGLRAAGAGADDQPTAGQQLATTPGGA
ncbi:hypothetical protein MY55_21595 [Chromobacterium subtsugae]|nr:hypothetical protein [Chromobacterium subtsugae]OBU84544.1 hypothetical protein MY55_21595 [Chromobacterium subtsugae]